MRYRIAGESRGSSGDRQAARVGRGVKITDTELDALPLTRHDWHGDWNYTLTPNLVTGIAAGTYIDI